MAKQSVTRRYELLDVIRGITLISMIAYHGAWDLVYIAGIDWPWYHTNGAYLWQQSICWTFILLSGFCMTLSEHKWKRGGMVFGGGILVSAVTLLVMPDERVVFGVLTFIGSAMLLTDLLERFLFRMPGILGFPVCAYLFYLFRDVNSGVLHLFAGTSLVLPRRLYSGYVATFLGFTDASFYSTDYFPLLPWLFLFWCGLYLGIAMKSEGVLKLSVFHLNIRPLSFLGRHSLLIYLLHQPVLYAMILVMTRLFAL